MRPIRLLLSLCSLIVVTLLLYVVLQSREDGPLEQQSTAGKQGSFKALFSFTSPGSLFPPSAIISLTDDNSTFFLARPAAFGPSLPKDGLSSGLWIGSGFGDDAMGNGELGCGDSPNWDHHNDRLELGTGPLLTSGPYKDPRKNDEGNTPTASAGENLASLAYNDGTDDHQHAPSAGHASTSASKKKPKEHSDIQSLQESAEIDGKVVLLRRGGCGFLAKVMWAQKRGAVAVIVGDNQRGGGLIHMYAQGDTSNVTIPSLFTSHTTAHLLSSLLPGGTINGLPSGKTVNTDPNKGAVYGPGKSKEGNVPTTKVPLISSRTLSNFAPTSMPNKQGHRTSVHGTAGLSQSGNGWVDTILFALGLGPSSSVAAPSKHAQGEAGPAPVSAKLGTHVLPGSGEYPRTTLTDSERNAQSPQAKHTNGRSITSITDNNLEKVKNSSKDSAPHEGLWVTLTPTNVSTSPFFDTLLVLVVSPLVTLTVVYALLLLRSRIRRRRWRAPKSLVERLPVRTYQTMSDSTSSATPSAASPTTPLLQHSSSSPVALVHSPSPQGEAATPAASCAIPAGSRTREEEKRETGLAEWRRRYGGRQKECVVCLEEYEDGISQVMSLPCGHEFHADCITPWLVTRRRTCPICKGDVVRSLAQSYHDRSLSPSPTRSPLHLGNLEDVQTLAVETRNDSPSASLPMPISTSAPITQSRIPDDDIEANWSGDDSLPVAGDVPTNRASEHSSSFRDLSSTVSTVIWRGVEVVRNTTGFQRRPPDDVDRDR